MNAARDILVRARGAGVGLTIDGDDLRLHARQKPPPDLVNLLKQHKQDIIACLRVLEATKGRIVPEGERWNEADWLEYFTERAAIAEHDGGLPRDRAERIALDACVVEWLRQHPPPADPDVCAACGKPANSVVMDWRILGDGATVHYGGDHDLRCFRQHSERRKESALKALAALNIQLT